MKCITCEKISLSIICKSCQNNLLKASFYKREIEKDFYNYSFYGFSEIEDLISSKYYFHGDKIFNILAKLSFLEFSKKFKLDENILAVPIDDHTRHNFSHTAILAKHLKSNISVCQFLYSNNKGVIENISYPQIDNDEISLLNRNKINRLINNSSAADILAVIYGTSKTENIISNVENYTNSIKVKLKSDG